MSSTSTERRGPTPTSRRATSAWPRRSPRSGPHLRRPVPDLADYGIDLTTLRRMYDEWKEGAKKSVLERRYLNRSEAHGKLFSNLVREHLGIETERRSSLAAENEVLRAENQPLRKLLRDHGIDTGHL